MYKKIVALFIVIFMGILFGNFVYKSSNIKNIDTHNMNKVYLLQYGVYSKEENMINNTKNISDYFYFKDEDGYHVIIGIVENKNNYKKIGESFGVMENIYLKEVNVSNMEFIENLRQYEKLINDSNDNNFIINAEKQLLSKYEELVLNNE